MYLIYIATPGITRPCNVFIQTCLLKIIFIIIFILLELNTKATKLKKSLNLFKYRPKDVSAHTFDNVKSEQTDP